MSIFKKPTYIILIFLITSILNLFALEINQIAKIDFQENDNLLKTKGLGGNLKIRNDGAFIYERVGNPYSWTIVVKSDKSHFIYIPILDNATYSTNFLSTTNINGIKYDNVEITENQNEISINSNIILHTISNYGYISLEKKEIGTNIYIFKTTTAANQNPKALISAKYNPKTESLLKKYNSNGTLISQINLSGLKLNDSNLQTYNADSIFLNKIVVFCQITDTNLIFYRLTDSDLLSSPNRITLGSSQNGSLTATVNNPEQAFLNIQSSTNLIDWNTFKTIKNEPSLEIVVPENKPKEFIRAIE